MRVALVVMPFAASNRPSLAVGLLKALLTQRGIRCECKYFNLTCAGLLGRERYEKLGDLFPTCALAGEWIFSQIYFGASFSSWETYSQEVLGHAVWGLPEEDWSLIQDVKKLAPVFLRIAYESCDWSQFDLVGFTSTFEQTMPSMCLARMIRQHHPRVKIAVGGANFEGAMGRVYFDLFPEIDFAAIGEADASFPRLCENLARGIAAVPKGILHRQEGNGEQEAEAVGPVPMDSLPAPDYDEFFSVLARTFPASRPAVVMLEASRGCWWGEKRHCTFCGLNGATMAFRRKDWRRVDWEAAFLAERYRPELLQFADNIMAVDYFKTLLPHWSQNPGPTPKFFEVKSNLKREQVVLLWRAGVVCIQPGIESLADRTLELMDKGVSAAQNIALLRWCREIGVKVAWNLLFGFPGEDLDDYAKILEVMRKLAHLRAPIGCGLIRMDRFSPNFTQWKEKGFSAIRPMPAYKHVFPLSEEGLGEVAYFFDYEHAQLGKIAEPADGIVEFGMIWKKQSHQENPTNGTFAVKRHLDGGWILVDSRFNRPRASYRLSADDVLLLRLADAPTTREAMIRRAASLWNGGDQSVEASYESLREKEALIEIGGKTVALSLLPDELRQAVPSFEREVDRG
ncbi:MAG TPA: RiPP maturation radical SAM C-methyltransferase [Thermoanaerobaculia bacterium]